MSFKLPATMTVLSLSLLLLGAGCSSNVNSNAVTNSSTSTNSSSPSTTTNTQANAATTNTTPTQNPSQTVAEPPCPAGTERYSTTTSDPAFSFCHEGKTTLTDGADLVISEQKGIVTLFPKTDPQSKHTVRAVRLNTSEDVSTAIAAQFMTADNRAVCDVNAGKSFFGSNVPMQYVIAGGDLDTQEKCGDYRTGFFLSSAADPSILFFLETGQDTFLTDTWIKTLRPVTE